MPTPLGHRRALYGVVRCILLLLFIALPAVVQAQSATQRPAILYTGHLNFDCVQDTVYGLPDAAFRYHPTVIRWGQGDSACGIAMPQDRLVAETIIRYPDWRTLGVSVGFQRMNTDSLDDMVIYLWGSVNDSTGQRDTIRPILIFGQQGLDTLPELDLAAIGAFQIAPFFAMELRVGSELVEPALRDLSGVTSYLLTPVAFEIPSGDTTHQENPGDTAQGPPVRIRIYPNPAGYEAQVEVDSLPPGDYYVEIVGVNGLVYLQQTVSVSMSGTLFGMLDLHAMLTGYYLVRVHDGNRVFALYPILITR